MVTFGLCWIFFPSGVAALVFENPGFYPAGIAPGDSVWASSLVLAGFDVGAAARPPPPRAAPCRATRHHPRSRAGAGILRGPWNPSSP
jgi:hypothetical protein